MYNIGLGGVRSGGRTTRTRIFLGVVVAVSGCDTSWTGPAVAPPIRRTATNDIGRTDVVWGQRRRGNSDIARRGRRRRRHGRRRRRRRIASSRRTPHGPHDVVRVRVCVCVCVCQQPTAAAAATTVTAVSRAQQSHTVSVRGPPSVVFGRTSLRLRRRCRTTVAPPSPSRVYFRFCAFVVQIIYCKTHEKRLVVIKYSTTINRIRSVVVFGVIFFRIAKKI